MEVLSLPLSSEIYKGTPVAPAVFGAFPGQSARCTTNAYPACRARAGAGPENWRGRVSATVNHCSCFPVVG